jgi:nicotinamide-nucleotide amidase
MDAEIVSIGTELLRGEVIDTNASYLASQLPLLGIDLYRVTQVGDERGRLVEIFRQAWRRSQLLLTTGGLGPTEDDLTREALSEMLGEELKVDPTLEQGLRGLFALWGREMPSHNIKQATLIPSAQAIPNPRGTAPGWWVEKEGKIVIAMPGPPKEMRRMWEKEVSPRLSQQVKGEIIISRTLKTYSLTEAEVDELVSRSSSPVEIGIYAKPDGIHLRLIARAPKQEEAEERIQQGEACLRQILTGHIWGVDDDTLEGVVGTLLADGGLTLATMESYTGGLLAATLSDAPRSCAYYNGGLVAPPKETSIALGVEAQLLSQYGATSLEVALAMATAARQRLEANIGIGVSGEDAVFIAVEDGRRNRTYHGNYPSSYPEAKRRATIAALFKLRCLLLSPD